MAEVDAQVVQVHIVPQHARALLEQAVDESRKILSAHRVQVEVEEPDEPVWFDPHLLSRVLRHLIENAARYTTPGGGILLRAWRTATRLEFSVEDDGPGFDPSELPLIFEKFYRGKSGLRQPEGSGMGLAITRAILIAHGGGIEASNMAVKGARLYFWVPMVDHEPGTNRPAAIEDQAAARKV
jgi:two-component system sensor histidine kinase KdpD